MNPQLQALAQRFRRLIPSLLALALIAPASFSKAQSDDITLDTKATPDQIQDWLVSSDPRLMSWGAHFAREQDNQPALTLMVQLLGRWTPAQGPQDKVGLAQFAPTTAILDALIQRGEMVPPDTLATIAPTFPAQAAILAARLPLTEATPLLLSWYGLRTGGDKSHLAKIAAMLLSHGPPPGFAASILSEAEEKLFISVVSPDAGPRGGTGFGGSCGDSLQTPRDPAWPSIFVYSIDEDSFQQTETPLVEAAGYKISYFRHEQNSGGGSCNYLGLLDANSRHHLLAQMLSINDDQLPWTNVHTVSIVWQDNQQYRSDAMDDVATEEAKLRTTVEALQTGGLLTGDEAAAVRPKLSVTVKDDRQPIGEALSPLRFADPRTVLAPVPQQQPAISLR